jgi:phosphate-selective porin OprO and OprP
MANTGWMKLWVLVLLLAVTSTASADDDDDGERLEDPARAVRVADAEVDPETITFKPGDGLYVASRDGRFSLTTRLRTQIQYVFEHPHASDEDDSQNLQIRRMRLVFSGHTFHRHVRYYVQLGFSNRDMLAEGDSRRTPIRDVRIDLDHLRDFTLRIGETKVPFSRERVISSGNLQMVDRSIVNEEFNLDRDAGVQAFSRDLGGLGHVGYAAGVFIGEGRGQFQQTGIDLMYVGRLEVFPLGKFEDYSMVDFERTRPRLSLGVAYAYLQDGKRTRGLLGDLPADGGTTDSHNVTADVLVKALGFSALIAFHYRDGTRTPGGAVDDMGLPIPVEAARNGWGLLVQPGYLIPRTPYELSLRYAHIRGTGETSLQMRNEAGVGFGWYFADHNLKLQVDYFRSWGDQNSDEDRVRAQTQLAF